MSKKQRVFRKLGNKCFQINKKIIYSLMLVLCIGLASAELPTRGQGDWDVPLISYLNESLEGNGTLRAGIVELNMLDLSTISLASFTNDAGYLTGTKLTVNEIDSETVSGTIQIQQNADSSGRVRFFRNTTANPMVNFWGYDSTDAVQKYLTIGLFDNAAYSEAGSTLRAIITSGGNTAGTLNALEIQSPSQVRITAVDDILNLGNVRIASDTFVEIYTRASAEVNSANRLVIDNVGDVVSGDIELSNPGGNIVFNPGYTGTCAGSPVVVGGIVTACS